MNRFLLFLGSSLLVAGTAHAQLGLRLGGNIANLHTADGSNLYNNSGAKLGYQVGLTYRVPLSKWLAVVPEVQFSQEQFTMHQGSYAIADAGFSAASRQHLRYLNVPVLVRASLGPVYVEAGPQASVLLGGRLVGTSVSSSWMGATTSYDFDQPATNYYRRFDAGACVGIGVMLPAGLGLSVRAYRGLVTLNPERSTFDGVYKRQSLQASLTYQLPTR